jgi:hypothetical protein
MELRLRMFLLAKITIVLRDSRLLIITLNRIERIGHHNLNSPYLSKTDNLET